MPIHRSKSAEETKKWAESIAKKATPPVVICLYGNLGSGKTTFTKGFARALGCIEQDIKSPTYTFVRTYKVKNATLHHFDFYRIEELDDLMEQELKELFEKQDVIILIEWPERIADMLPKHRINIRFEISGEAERIITCEYA